MIFDMRAEIRKQKIEIEGNGNRVFEERGKA
jgi:hypothetical protein